MSIAFEGQVFSGFIYTLTYFDIMSYLAKMRDGLDGGWFYTNPFTTEDVKPVFLFVFYIALGHVARLTGLSLIAVYHLARVGLGVFLLAAVDRMIRGFGWKGPARLFAFALVFFASGFGWLLRWTRIEIHPVEFMETEGFVFQSMMSYPHFVLALALMVWILSDAWRFGRNGSGLRILAPIAVAAFVLAWVHPRPLLTLVTTSALAAVWGGLRGLWDWKRWAIPICVIVLVATGPMVISLLTVRADPLWAEWSRTETLSSPPWQYLIAYGLLWPLALIGLVRGARRNEPWAPLLGSWLIMGSLLPFLPIAAQVRLIIGWNIPLALLSGYALGDWIVPGMRAASPRLAKATPGLVSVLILLLCLTSIAYLGLGVWRVMVCSFPTYYSQERAEAMDWLRTHTGADETVLGSSLTSMFIPGYAGNRVVHGHWAETFRLKEKTDKVERIFDAETTAPTRQTLLEELRVRYLFYGQWEQQLGEYDPAADGGLWTPRWKGPTTTIFERSAPSAAE